MMLTKSPVAHFVLSTELSLSCLLGNNSINKKPERNLEAEVKNLKINKQNPQKLKQPTKEKHQNPQTHTPQTANS